MYQNSVLVFHRQLKSNAKAFRIKKVATKQCVIQKAEATIQAMENETKADLKYVLPLGRCTRGENIIFSGVVF